MGAVTCSVVGMDNRAQNRPTTDRLPRTIKADTFYANADPDNPLYDLPGGKQFDRVAIVYDGTDDDHHFVRLAETWIARPIPLDVVLLCPFDLDHIPNVPESVRETSAPVVLAQNRLAQGPDVLFREGRDVCRFCHFDQKKSVSRLTS
ncbi:MAG: hypothetical protein JWN40_1658 [Phycisphaerales bacterium]|nr:hypothetical protein [Phycisphaerales bacterium]